MACPVISDTSESTGLARSPLGGHDPNAPGRPGALGSGSQIVKKGWVLNEDTPGVAACGSRGSGWGGRSVPGVSQPESFLPGVYLNVLLPSHRAGAREQFAC